MNRVDRVLLVISILTVFIVVSRLSYALIGEGATETAAVHHDPIAPVLLALSIILFAAKLCGILMERLKQPAVLGELLCGVIIGNLGLISPAWDFFAPLRVDVITEHWAIVIDCMARIGVLLLLFEVGVEATVGEMKKVGTSSFLVALVGVIVPFFLGYGVSWLFIKDVPLLIPNFSPVFELTNIHILIGATLCATSVGITVRVFKDLGASHTKEAKIILGAAVVDDVLGLIILAIAAGIITAAQTGVPLEPIVFVRIAGTAVGFLVGAIILGLVYVPRTLNLIARLRTNGLMLISSLLFCFIVSFLAHLAGLAPIVGAFAAGLVLEEAHFLKFEENKSLTELLNPVTTLLVPIFFTVIGIQVRVEAFMQVDVLVLAAALTVAAFIGKQICGLAVVEHGLNRLAVGIGMVPRGEVGLVFASIGKSLGVLDNAIFSAIVLMVIITTLITPTLLKLSLSRQKRKITF